MVDSYTVSGPTLSSLAVLYPSVLDQPPAYLLSKSPNLELRLGGAGNQIVCLSRGKDKT